MERSRAFILSLTAVLLWAACSTQPEAPVFEPEIAALPADPADYAPVPTYEAMSIPADNPITAEKAALGRQLFFDMRLSGDGSRSCYSCHQCDLGLADGKPTAVGAFERPLTRNSPTLWNIGYHSEFYWDGRANSLEGQALAAWRGGNMGAGDNLDQIVGQLNSTEGYASQFQSVFGGEATPDNVSQALTTYMRTIVSHETPWDAWQAGDQSAVSEAAKRGFEAFKKAECNNCHDGVFFTDLQYHNVGIGMDAEEPDVGRFRVTENESDTGAFKTPTLRDISQSAPYFHNGSSTTLEEAVDIMLGGGLDNPHLDRTNLKKADLSAEERSDLIEFLRSLDQACNLSEPPLPPSE
jgi:cytochrome c peroxidase